MYQQAGLFFNLISQEMDDVAEAISALKASFSASNSSRKMAFVSLNPDFTVHDSYLTQKCFNDLYKTLFTKFHLCGHNLAVETGSWNRRGRGPPFLERVALPMWGGAD